MNNPLATTSVLLLLTVSKWAAEVTDLKALKAVAKAFSSDTHDDKYKKALFIGDPLQNVDRCAGRLRNNFYRWTLNWNEAGQGRLMPSQDFRIFAGEHKKLSADFFRETDKFIDDYPDHCLTAKQHKGDMYNEKEYPPVDIVRSKFDVQLITLPFPTTHDFRVEAPQAIIDELKQQIDSSITAVNGTVDAEINVRLKERLAMLLKTLRVGKRFNKTLLSELAFVCTMAINIKGALTPATLAKVQVIENQICSLNPDAIRNSQTVQDDLITLCGKLI